MSLHIPDRQLSPHFRLSELTRTDQPFDNTPNAAQLGLLLVLAYYAEKVRHILGDRPVLIHSAFRSRAVNAAVGGVETSAHPQCYAIDFECPSFGSVYQVALAIDRAGKALFEPIAVAPRIAFDQLIYEQTWVHLSRDPRLRSERWTKSGAGYIRGLIGP